MSHIRREFGLKEYTIHIAYQPQESDVLFLIILVLVSTCYILRQMPAIISSTTALRPLSARRTTAFRALALVGLIAAGVLNYGIASDACFGSYHSGDNDYAKNADHELVPDSMRIDRNVSRTELEDDSAQETKVVLAGNREVSQEKHAATDANGYRTNITTPSFNSEMTQQGGDQIFTNTGFASITSTVGYRGREPVCLPVYQYLKTVAPKNSEYRSNLGLPGLME